MTPAERHLVWFLRATAIMFMAAAPFVFVPTAWMRPIGALYGVEVPETPLVEYLARSVSAVYAVMGTTYWFMSRDVRRYLPLLWFNFFMCIAFDVAVIAVDALIPMPLVWTLGEAVALVGWTIVFGWLVWRAS